MRGCGERMATIDADAARTTARRRTRARGRGSSPGFAAPSVTVMVARTASLLAPPVRASMPLGMSIARTKPAACVERACQGPILVGHRQARAGAKKAVDRHRIGQGGVRGLPRFAVTAESKRRTRTLASSRRRVPWMDSQSAPHARHARVPDRVRLTPQMHRRRCFPARRMPRRVCGWLEPHEGCEPVAARPRA